MADEQTVVLEVEGGVAEIRLVRGEAGNAINVALAEQLAEAVGQVEEKVAAGEVRAVLVTAEGHAFTFGGDITLFVEEMERIESLMLEMARQFNGLVLRLADLPVPVVTAVQGAAAGGGLGLVWAADFVYCSPEAFFAPAFDRIGHTGDGGGTWFLPRLVGLRRAQEMTLGGRIVRAEEAAEWGLVNEVVPADELHARARAEAERLAAGPTKALAMTGELVRGSFDRSLAEQLELEAQYMSAASATDDGKEGLRAFIEKRRPDFRGA